MSWKENNGFEVQKIHCRDDYEGRVEATLLSRKTMESEGRSILYIHGFVDYFFQTHLAAWANNLNYDFHALDLRKYGRSMMPHQKPNNFRHMDEYYEEIDAAIDLINSQENGSKCMIMGHSTGGLIASLYVHDRKEVRKIDGLILNSPFFAFNVPQLVNSLVVPVSAAIGRRFPDIVSPEGLKTGYPMSIHKDYHGEWDFDLRYKPIEGFKLNLGWLNAIHGAQKRLQAGLDIPCPVLVMHSDKSVTPGNYHEGMHSADSVLSVDHISRYAGGIGKKVQTAEITDGLHDLVLSRKEVRAKVFDEMEAFLASL